MSARDLAPPLFMDDPNWADFIPALPSGGPKCHAVAHDDCSPLDADAAAAHLAPGGTLGTMAGYEARPGQLDMTRAVARAYSDRRHLMIEAGTGVGKSLAYLVPSVLWSWLNDTPVIISTATRNLQSQLITSDIPRAARVLGADAPKSRAAVLKGRTNYLCLRALADYMQGGYYTLSTDEQHEFARFLEWLHRTEDGDLDDLSSETLRPRLSCTGEDCLGRRCPWNGKCFVAKARARALRAHVVVANHALVLADAVNPGADILPVAGRLVFDEAHDLEDIATEFFSYELSRPALQQLLGRVARTTRSRRGHEQRRGVVGAVERQLRKGALAQAANADHIRALCTQAETQSAFALRAADEMFEVLERLFTPAPEADRLRFRCVAGSVDGEAPPARRQFARKGIFADYPADAWHEADLTAAAVRFEDKLARLQATLTDLGESLDAASPPGELPLFGDLATSAKALAASFTEFILESKFVLKGNDATRVFWAERVAGREARRGRRKHDGFLKLTAAPLSVAAEMKKCFFDVKDTVVLCSATLRTGDKFDYMARKLGFALVAPDRVKALVAASPFDYLRQALVLAADFLPDPAVRGRDYAAALASLLGGLFAVTRGRGLVLFTSYEMMRAVTEAARPAFATAGIELLVQGEGLSREAMTAALKRAAETGARTVLFGAQSFWEGVDVPGAALSCVVLARLPFPQVGEPIVEARSEKVTEDGGSAFRDYMLPEALIKFRQGFGRLVRTKADTGVVLVADPRVVTKNYGALFRKALPASVHAARSADEVLARVREWFGMADAQFPRHSDGDML